MRFLSEMYAEANKQKDLREAVDAMTVIYTVFLGKELLQYLGGKSQFKKVRDVFFEKFKDWAIQVAEQRGENIMLNHVEFKNQDKEYARAQFAEFMELNKEACSVLVKQRRKRMGKLKDE